MTEQARVHRFKSPGYWVVVIGATMLLCASTGCQELVHMGQLSDRETASSVGGARIEQQTGEGGWKYLGETDGNGRWWILKDKVKGNGGIRITKPGYYTLRMAANEFMTTTNIIMIPTGGTGLEDEGGGAGLEESLQGKPRRANGR